jgi:hypothetical protein
MSVPAIDSMKHTEIMADASNPQSENMKDKEKWGAQWETRARKIRKRVRNRTLKSRNKKNKRSSRSSQNKAPDIEHCEV